MKHENDKWLESQMKTAPSVEDNDFSAAVMKNIELDRVRQSGQRRKILQLAYVISGLLFLLIAPWNWLTEQIFAGQSLVGNMVSSTSETSASVFSISILFVVIITTFVLGQESSR